MSEEWSMIGIEERRIGGLEEQRSGMMQQHDRMASHEGWDSGEKERTHWQGRKRQVTRGNHEPWLNKSNSYSDPDQSTSSSSCKDRLRNIKFTEEENDILVTKVLENYPKLYGDDASRTSSFEKKRIWRGILESINRLGVSVRNVDTCKKRFADCKRFVRSKMSKNWRHPGKRQSVSVYYAEWEEKIKAIICPLVEGIPGLIDSADPCTYECPGHWSPPENASPEATLSPIENETPEVPFYPDTQIPTNSKPQTTNEDWPAFRDPTAVNVKEEGGINALEMPSAQDGQDHQEHFSSIPQWGQRQPEVRALPEMDQLVYQSQEAFRRTLRRQLHAVRQEIREFRRDHTERMDLLLTLHREHILVEEQRNEILSQLVSTVNNLATKLSSTDTCNERQCLQPPLDEDSTSKGENSPTKPGTSAQTSPRYPSRQSPEDLRNTNINHRRKILNHGQFSSKRKK
ncbi:uncharacterized protein LOC134583523 [Pelobates fuscus]|uniref:uncharacterized protein LOC134583523 n=1 Tax=Pelobates fuscus TaxID=191477 RepID=UPI002FE455A6